MTRPILIRGARLLCPDSGLDHPGDLLVVDRRIAAIRTGGGAPLPDGGEVVEARGALLVPGLIDTAVFAVDVEAAVASGVTTAFLMPDQRPALDDPALVERAERLGKPRLWIRPLAAASQGLEGRRMAELALLKDAGAIAVATGRQAIADPGVMLRLMRYAAGAGLVVIIHPEDPMLTAGAVATDGETATRLGLASAPSLGEALLIARDLRLAEEAGAAIHFAPVTTAEGVELIRRARARGQDVSAGTSPAYALLNDTAVTGWRSFARLSPPLRAEDDRQAVRAGLADGTLSMLASRHDPRTTEDKRQPFAEAAPGAADGGTLLAASLALVHDGLIGLGDLVRLLSANAARRFGLEAGRLVEGAPADLLLFDAHTPFQVRAEQLPGRGRNTAFDGLPLMGRPRLVLKGGEPS